MGHIASMLSPKNTYGTMAQYVGTASDGGHIGILQVKGILLQFLCQRKFLHIPIGCSGHVPGQVYLEK